MSADERESQLSAMFDGELPDSECELLARRLSRDPVLQQHWARYSLIGAVLRDEPLHAHRASGGRLAAGIAARLSTAIEAEATAASQPGEAAQGVTAVGDGGGSAARGAGSGAAGAARWLRPVAGLSIAAGVAGLSVFCLQVRAPEGSAPGAALEPARVVEVIAPSSVVGAAPAEIVVAGAGYAAATDREPESYVVPLPPESRDLGPPAQLANYVVAHSEYSGTLSRRSLLSALVAADAAVAEQGNARAERPAPAGGAAAGGELSATPGLRSAEVPK